jgi:hypothetical protein
MKESPPRDSCFHKLRSELGSLGKTNSSMVVIRSCPKKEGLQKEKWGVLQSSAGNWRQEMELRDSKTLKCKLLFKMTTIDAMKINLESIARVNIGRSRLLRYVKVAVGRWRAKSIQQWSQQLITYMDLASRKFKPIRQRVVAVETTIAK